MNVTTEVVKQVRQPATCSATVNRFIEGQVKRRSRGVILCNDVSQEVAHILEQ